MSALTDLFQSMANKIRSKTGTATTYTPPQMVSDGIDDVFDAGVASATTPITPSNSSPVAMAADTGYKPTAGGYAISSYVSKAPSNSLPPSLTAGDMCKIENNGYAVANITGVTPSNSSPVALSQNDICGINQNGYAIESYDSIQPSNIPRDVASGDIVKISTYSAKIIRDTYLYDLTPSDSNPVLLSGQQNFHVTGSSGVSQGWAIASQPASKTPSDTSPVSVTSGSIIKPSSAGYLVKTVSKIAEQPDKVYTSDSNSASGTTTITVTKKPRYAFVSAVTTSNSNYFYMYMYDFTKSKAWRFARAGSSTINSEDYSSNISTMFPTVSSSSVVFNNASIAATKRLFIALYY